MSKSAKEIVERKFISLKRKVQHAHHRVDQLHERFKSSSMDLNSLNLNFALDNMLFSLDDLIVSFDDMCPELQPRQETKSKGDFSQEAASPYDMSKQEPAKDTINADVISRLHNLEREFRTIIHGGGDGDSSSQRGILPHMAHLENSFNEGKQKIISFEHRLQDLNVRHIDLINEVRHNAKKENENVVVMERFKTVEGSFQAIVSDNDDCKRRLTSVEDQIKAVKPVCGAESSEKTQDVKTELGGLRMEFGDLKTLILPRIYQLEHRQSAAFTVDVKHNGPWKEGAAIREVDCILLNEGNVFQEDGCRFLAPVGGTYCFILFLMVDLEKGNGSKVDLCRYDQLDNHWSGAFCSVSVNKTNIEGCDVAIYYLNEGDAVRLRVSTGSPFQQCRVHGFLVSPKD